MDTTDFGPMLKARRLTAGLSQEQLAERAFMSVDTISALERGARRAPYRATIDALAGALELSAEERLLFHAAASRRKRAQLSSIAQSGRLPSYSTRFIGRDVDRTAVAELLARFRILTISGPGGIGKTRLAVETVREAAGVFPNAFFTDLAGIREGAHVASAVAAAAGLRLSTRLNVESIAEAFAGRQALLILDNCEHVIEASAALIEGLIRFSPGVRVLATSRRPLLIDGEALYRLEPLDVEAASVELFADRAALVRADEKDRVDEAAVLEICRQLEGFPLAIELVAARTRIQSVGDIAATLDDDDAFASEQRRTSVEHHRSMESAIAWSYTLLSPQERDALQLIAFFGGGCTLDAARALIGSSAPSLVRSLIDASVVVEELAGELDEAAAVSCSIVEQIATAGAASDLPRLLDRMALIAVRFGELETAVKLTGFVDKAIEQTGVTRSPTDSRVRTDIDIELARLLEPGTREQLLQTGATLSPRVAVEAAVAAVG